MNQLSSTKKIPTWVHGGLITLCVCAGFFASPVAMAQTPKKQNTTDDMRNWDVVDDRRNATLEFAAFMKDPKNEETRKKCFNDPAEAKRQFALVGRFYLEGEPLSNQPPNDGKHVCIPKTVQFKMYDSEDQKRDDLVVMVFPSALGSDTTDPMDIWMAAWQPWRSGKKIPIQGKSCP